MQLQKKVTVIIFCCLLAVANPIEAFASNEHNPNLEYIRMAMDLSNQIESKLTEGNFTDEDTFSVEVLSENAPGKKVAKDVESSHVANDEFATEANNSNVDLFLMEMRDYSIAGTSGQFKGYKNEDDIYLTELTADTTVWEASDIVAAREKAKQVANEIKSQTEDQKEMVRMVNTYLTQNTQYIKNYNTDTQKWLWSSTGPLLHGEAVCMGYAYAFKSILDELDIPAQTILGQTKNGINHAWSRCRIDGEWLYCDITFNDTASAEPSEDYLLLGKEEFYKKTGHQAIYDPGDTVADNAYNVVYRNDQRYEAALLNKEGLFKGDDRGYRLEDGLTRAEMAVLITRVVGGIQDVDSNAELYASQCIYNDVPNWAKKYVGYCMSKGLVKGIGNNLYGSDNMASKLDFCTVMLRATGVAADDKQSTADEKAVELGYINEGRTAYVDLNRADVVQVLYNVHMLGKI